MSWSEWAFAGLALLVVFGIDRWQRWVRMRVPTVLAGIDPSDSDQRRRTFRELRLTAFGRLLLIYAPCVMALTAEFRGDAGLGASLVIMVTLGLIALLAAFIASWYTVWVYSLGA